MKLLLAAAVLALFVLQSCTVVTSTNIPGKKEDKFPKFMLGSYELEYPGDLAALASEGATTVKITATQATVTANGEEAVSVLNDSIFVSRIGKQYYLSLGAEPSVSVFRIVKSGKNIELYSMFGMEAISGAELQPYFSKVTEIPGEPDEETGEIGPSSYEVTIDDKKLDAYFKSAIPSTEPFRLKKVK